jgi:hypothetical protein
VLRSGPVVMMSLKERGFLGVRPGGCALRHAAEYCALERRLFVVVEQPRSSRGHRKRKLLNF